MKLRPATDSNEDYVAIKQMYDDWKQLNNSQSFTFSTYVSYIRRLIDLSSILFVVVDKDEIVGSCKIILEPKLVFGTYVCHVEDVVVQRACRGQGIGTFMMQTIIQMCAHRELDASIIVYKVRLSCFDTLQSFYETSQFKRTGCDMVHYVHDNMVVSSDLTNRSKTETI